MQDTQEFRASPDGGLKKDVFTVSRLNMEVRSALENSFPLLWVTGELSNLSQPRSGHVYFSLKDPGAQVRCALFRSRRLNLRFQPRDGMQVLVRARVTLFEPRGDFQLVVEHMEPAGEGILRQQIEALKQKLAAEGLFDESLKRPLPAFPRRIGIVTSPSGAAVRDVLTVLRRRFPSISVVIYPVPVQGEGAAVEIRRMLEVADARGECDLLVLTRGGGSLEDLMAFNDEGLVRAIRACSTPVVSAIGHEIDVTLADFAADRRAPTPSAAAELASPDSSAVSARFDDQVRLLQRAVKRQVHKGRLALDAISARLRQTHPGRRLQQQQQRLDELEQRLTRRLNRDLMQRATTLERATGRLRVQSPERRIADRTRQLATAEQRLSRAVSGQLRLYRDRWAALTRHLDAVSPLATLGRGYAIVCRTDDGRVVTRSSEAAVGETVEARLAEGRLICRVEKQKD